MAHMTKKESWARIGGIFLGTVLAILILDLSNTRGEHHVSTDRNTQCAWVLTATSQAQTSAIHPLSPEPDDELLLEEDVNIVTGLYTRSYSRRQNGAIDYQTARQIITSEYNTYWNTVVETKEFPLFYWEDSNQDGTFEMWVDQQGDGYPCDIIPYQRYDNSQDTQLAGY